jgi:hypothetical protein
MPPLTWTSSPSCLQCHKQAYLFLARFAHTHGVLSLQNWSQHLGLDYDQEQKNLAMHGGK